MIDWAFLSAAALAFIAAAYKARGLRKEVTPAGLRALCLLLTTLGFSLVFISNTAQQVENAIYPNLGRLLSNVCTILTALSIVIHLLEVSHAPEIARSKIRRRVQAFAACVTGMTVLFLSSPLPPMIGDFGALYEDRPALVAYNVIYAAGLGTAMVDLLTLAGRHARHAHRVAMRIGLYSVSAGGAVALAYLSEKVVIVIWQAAGFPAPLAGHDRPCSSAFTPVGCMFSVGFPVGAAILIVVGMTMPAWGPALTAPVRWVRYVRLYRRLRPLWESLREEFPQIVLPVAPRVGIRWRLHRRVIEVRDGLVALQPYGDPAARAEAMRTARQEGLPASRVQVLAHAALIRSSLESRRAGAAPARSPDDGLAVLDELGELDGLMAEATWLAEVADALAGLTARRPSSLDQSRRDTSPEGSHV